MMKGRFKLLLPTFLLCVSTLCYAEVSDEAMNKILELSGITKQVEQFPELIKAGMEQARQQGTPIPDNDHRSILSIVDQLVIPSEIIVGIRASLNEALNEEDIKQLLAWYESDLGREITRAEEAASTPEAYQEMMQSAQSLMEDLDRLEYAMRIDMSLGLTRMNMDLQEQTGIAVYSAIMSAIQPGEPLDLAPLKEQMKAEREQTREAIKDMVLVSLVYSYRDIDLDKLKQYEAFLNDPVAVKFTKTAMKGMYHGIKSSVSRIMEAMIMLHDSKKQDATEG